MVNLKNKVIGAIRLAAETADYVPVENLLAELNAAVAAWSEPDVSKPEVYAGFFGDLPDLWAAKQENRYFRNAGWLADVKSHGFNAYIDWYVDDASKIEDCTSLQSLLTMKHLVKDVLITVYTYREPTSAHAIAVGVKDETYPTQRYGDVPAYSGEVVIKTGLYTAWKAEGFRSKGNAAVVSVSGGIKFSRIDLI